MATLRSLRMVAAIVTAIGFAAPVHAKSLSTPLSYNSEGLPFAEFVIDGGGPYRMIVDTAAAMSAVNEAYAAPMGATSLPGAVNVIGLLDTQHAARVRVDDLRSGPFTASVDMIVLDDARALKDPEAAGIAGLDMLDAMSDATRYIELDFAHGYIRTAASTRRLADRRARRWTSLTPLPGDLKLIAIPVSIQGVKGVAVLDSGLDFAVINTAYANALKARKRGEFVEVTDVNADTVIAEVVTARRLKGNGFEWRKFRAMVLDPTAFETLGLADTPAMLLGANFLSDLRIVLDREKRRVLIDAPGRTVRAERRTPQPSSLH